MPQANQSASAHFSKAKEALQALQQARDGVMAKVAELGEHLQLANDKIQDLTDSFKFAQLERDAALECLNEAREECRGLRQKLENVAEASGIASAHDENSPTVSAERLTKAPSIVSANLRSELDGLREELRIARSQPDVIIVGTGETELPSGGAPAKAVAHGLDLIVSEEVQSELAAIDFFLGELEKDPSNLEPLDVLSGLFRDSSERALSVGCLPVHRLATACGEFTSWLQKTPRKTGGSIALLREARALIGRLMQDDAVLAIQDPSGAAIYAVDNDEGNCECLVMVLDKADFKTRYATRPDIAFGELAKGPVDLILLDVDLGETDGFDLHDLIRQIEHHLDTPVVFVSGLLSTNARLAGLSGPPASFVAKPYNLTELVLKVLCTILSSRLRQIERETSNREPLHPAA